MTEINIRNGAYAYFATQPMVSLESVTDDALNELLVKAYAAGYKSVLAAKDAEIVNLRDLIRRNWQGSFWRAVNYRDADEVRAALNGGYDAP